MLLGHEGPTPIESFPRASAGAAIRPASSLYVVSVVLVAHVGSARPLLHTRPAFAQPLAWDTFFLRSQIPDTVDCKRNRIRELLCLAHTWRSDKVLEVQPPLLETEAKALILVGLPVVCIVYLKPSSNCVGRVALACASFPARARPCLWHAHLPGNIRVHGAVRTCQVLDIGGFARPSEDLARGVGDRAALCRNLSFSSVCARVFSIAAKSPICKGRLTTWSFLPKEGISIRDANCVVPESFGNLRARARPENALHKLRV